MKALLLTLSVLLSSVSIASIPAARKIGEKRPKTVLNVNVKEMDGELKQTIPEEQTINSDVANRVIVDNEKRLPKKTIRK